MASLQKLVGELSEFLGSLPAGAVVWTASAVGFFGF